MSCNTFALWVSFNVTSSFLFPSSFDLLCFNFIEFFNLISICLEKEKKEKRKEKKRRKEKKEKKKNIRNSVILRKVESFFQEDENEN